MAKATNPSGGQKRKQKLTARLDKDRLRVSLMCSTLVVSFLVFWLPFHSLHLAKLYGIPYGVRKLFSACRTNTNKGQLILFQLA